MDIPSTACTDIDDVEALENGVIIRNAHDQMALGTVNGARRTLYAFSSQRLAQNFVKDFLANRDARFDICQEPRGYICTKARAIAFTEICWDLTVIEVL